MGLFKRKPRLGYPVRAVSRHTGEEVYRGVLVSDLGGWYTISKATTAAEIGVAAEELFPDVGFKVEEVDA